MQTTKAMEKVCRDFSIFCDYVLENRIKLSKTTGYISKKDCFELNKLISVKESYEKATRTQNQYPVIHFFYYVALKYRILEIDYSYNCTTFCLSSNEFFVCNCRILT